MAKYTRREFFKGIIPVSVGVVSFLRGNLPQLGGIVNEPFIISHIVTSSANDDGIEWSDWSETIVPKITHGFINQEQGVFYEILADK